MWRIRFQHPPALGPISQRFHGTPGWVWKGAMAVIVLAVVIPLVLLTLAAVAAALIVLVAIATVIAVAWSLKRFLSGLRPQADDGRRNVRVIQRI